MRNHILALVRCSVSAMGVPCPVERKRAGVEVLPARNDSWVIGQGSEHEAYWVLLLKNDDATQKGRISAPMANRQGIRNST